MVVKCNEDHNEIGLPIILVAHRVNDDLQLFQCVLGESLFVVTHLFRRWHFGGFPRPTSNTQLLLYVWYDIPVSVWNMSLICRHIFHGWGFGCRRGLGLNVWRPFRNLLYIAWRQYLYVLCMDPFRLRISTCVHTVCCRISICGHLKWHGIFAAQSGIHLLNEESQQKSINLLRFCSKYFIWKASIHRCIQYKVQISEP